MNQLKVTIAIICFILIAYSCGSRGGNGTGGIGWTPVINEVDMYNVTDPKNPYEATTFGVGDKAYFNIDAQFSDADSFNIETTNTMKYVWITDFLLSSTETTTLVSGPTRVPLPGENGHLVVTFTSFDPITISPPAGDYRMDFQIEDSKGNLSTVISVTYQVF
jgi:hypothetical protein